MSFFNRTSRASLFIIVLLAVNAALLFLWIQERRPAAAPLDNAIFPEVSDLEGNTLSFRELSDYFTALSEDKGAEYAYEVLKRADMPPDTDMHLLGHVVGDALYRQQGAEGISICTHDFRNACSHSIVIGLLIDHGEAALPEITDACRNAPGGPGAYTMCFHGLGHGVAAYMLYDLPRTVALCEKTGTSEYGRREAAECVGGAIMELIGGGFHSPDEWRRKRVEYLSHDTPLGPCNTDIIPSHARYLCYTYLTPWLFEAAGGSIAHPTDATIVQTFLLCDAIASSEHAHRAACFGGIGKELVGLASARDIRDVSAIPDEGIGRIHGQCALAPHAEAERACTVAALASLYWGGENDPDGAIRFCSAAGDHIRDECFTNLFGQVSHYKGDDPAYAARFCDRISPEALRMQCTKALLDLR